MTKIEVLHKETWIVGFRASGHSGYARSGKDIVCAAISAITQTALLGLAHYAPDIQSQLDESTGFLEAHVPHPTLQTQAILTAMVLGLDDIQSGVPKYVRVIHIGQEVERNDESSVVRS